MRHGLLVSAALGGFFLVFIAARYGYKSTDDPFDAITWGFLYGFITLGGLFGHGFSLRTWRHNKRAGLFAFGVSALLFTISMSNSLGAMASRGNQQQAARTHVSKSVEDARTLKQRDEDELKGLKFTPTDETAYETAKKAAAAATAAKEAECKVRGPACRGKEDAEAKALAEEKAAALNKAATDRAAFLDAEIKQQAAKIDKAGPVLEANPQGSALAVLFGYSSAEAGKFLTWQNLGMGVAAELMVVTMTIIYEVLTKAHQEAQSRLPVPSVPQAAPAQAAAVKTMELRAEPQPELLSLVDTPRPRLITSQSEPPFGNVYAIVADIIEAGPGKVEIGELFRAYAQACKERGKRPVSPEKFGAEIKKLCEASGVKIEARGQLVYLLNVRLKMAAASEGA